MLGRLLVLLFLLVTPLLHGLNGAMQEGYGVKSKGMGGVGVAFPQDAFVVALNPAGLVWVCNQAELSLHWIQLRQRFRQGEMNFSSTEGTWLPEAAVAWHFAPCQSFGLAAYGFGLIDTRYDASIPGFGLEHRTGFEWKMYLFAPAWSFRLGSCFSVGAAVNVAYTWISVKGMEELASGAFSVAPQYVTNRGTDHEEGVSVRLGMLLRLPCLSVGLTYQTRTWLNAFKRYKGFLPDHGRMAMPSQWGVGIAWTPRGSLVLSADVLRLNWRGSKAFSHDVYNSGRYGAWDGPGFGWNDQTVVRVGAGFCPCAWLTLRAGFNWGEVPFEAQDVRLNALTASVVARHWTAGATMRRGRHELSLYFLEGVDHSVRDALNRVRAGESAVGGSYGFRF